jgi:ribonucleoside-diphosphate reductase beta chain
MKQKWILHGDETYNLAPFEYPWAFTMAQHSLANHWTPQEVPMGTDKACYELELTPEERYMFRNVFASLTTADLAIQENLTARVYDMIKAAEIRLYISRQIAEEGLHSASYQHVIETLGLDQAETYSLYRQVPEIKAWFDWSKDIVGVKDVMIPLIFYYAIFEGIFFPTAFAAIYSLHRRRLMTGTGQQIQYIHRDETMHVGFGIKLIGEIFAELGHRPETAAVHRLFELSLQVLDNWADRCIPPVLGYNADLHKRHSRYLADRRLKALGYPTFFHVEEALPWLDEMASIKKEKNFFESRVTEYQSGAGLSFEGSGSVNDILNWRGA